MKSYLSPVLLAILMAAFPFGSSVEEERGTTLVAPPWTHCLGLHKVTQFHLDVYSGYREKFNDPQGLFCVKLASEDEPDVPRDDDELTVYGVNSGNHDIIYNKSLVSIGIVGEEGAGKMRFRRPLALAGDAAGNLYVADAGNDRIARLRYDENDDLVWAGEIRGPAERPLRGPSGVAVGGGLIFVADTGNDRIAVFRPDGSFVKSFGAEWKGARLEGPLSLAVVNAGDEWIYYNDHFVAVTDSLGQRLWKLTPDGRAIGIVRRSALEGRGSFGHVAIDYYGSIYATDAEQGRIHKFTRYLSYIVAYGGGKGEAKLDEPRGISCFRRFGQIFVSERAGARYFWIGTDVLRFSADRLTFSLDTKRCGVEVSFLLTEYADITLILRDEGGKDRFTLLPDYILPPGVFKRRIEVPCPDAAELAKCKLSLVIIAKPTYSSREYLTVRRASKLLSPVTAASCPEGTP